MLKGEGVTFDLPRRSFCTLGLQLRVNDLDGQILATCKSPSFLVYLAVLEPRPLRNPNLIREGYSSFRPKSGSLPSFLLLLPHHINMENLTLVSCSASSPKLLIGCNFTSSLKTPVGFSRRTPKIILRCSKTSASAQSQSPEKAGETG